jgi:hypothetical protein
MGKMVAPIPERRSARDIPIACEDDFAIVRRIFQGPRHGAFNFDIDAIDAVIALSRDARDVGLVQSVGSKDGLISGVLSERCRVVTLQRDIRHPGVDAVLVSNAHRADQSAEPFAEIAS